MTNKNKQLTVYLSKSLLISDLYLEPIRTYLKKMGFIVVEYENGTTYSDKKLVQSDFVLLIPKLNPINNRNNKWNSFVGKGQYSEAELCYKTDKPIFIFHGLSSEGILMSKMEEFYSPYSPTINDSLDWKHKYGFIPSYVFGGSPVDLYAFLEGFFGLLNQNNEKNSIDYELLLLLSKI